MEEGKEAGNGKVLVRRSRNKAGLVKVCRTPSMSIRQRTLFG